MTAFSWTCPYCDRPTTVGDNDYQNFADGFSWLAEDAHSEIDGWTIQVIRCPNPACKKLTITASLCHVVREPRGRTYKPVAHHRLLPRGTAKRFPDYIPAAIRSDYEEAVLIRDLSPKASATLARRCLQGMIRDFWNVEGKRDLYQEIEAIKHRVDPSTWRAIDAVRSVGNIGAHMERDVGLIVDVDPGEAERLILLLETLLKEWYVHRHERDLQMKAVEELAKSKQAQRAPAAEPPTK